MGWYSIRLGTRDGAELKRVFVCSLADLAANTPPGCVAVPV